MNVSFYTTFPYTYIYVYIIEKHYITDRCMYIHVWYNIILMNEIYGKY